MRHSLLDHRIIEALDVLEALYFFLQSLHVNEERLALTRTSFRNAPRDVRTRLLLELRDEINWLRDESGALAHNPEYVELFAATRKGGDQGHALIPKWEIDRRWFRNFNKVIVRWPYVKDHAMVLYDPKDLTVRNRLFELEGSLFRDAGVLLQQAKSFHKGIDDFRKRTPDNQFSLHTYLNTAATLVFHFLEAYLNGLAFDCLIRHHEKLFEDDHDALTEWDRKKNVRRFTSAEKKIFKYPVIVGKCMNVKVDLSGCRAAHFLANDAKELGDALTHPSPHIDREHQTLHKISLVVALNLPFVESIFAAVKDYVLTVEKTLFGKPEETVPWLFARHGAGETNSPELTPKTKGII
jgi:hypothetical protein